MGVLKHGGSRFTKQIMLRSYIIFELIFIAGKTPSPCQSSCPHWIALKPGKATYYLVFRQKAAIRHKLAVLDAGDSSGLKTLREGLGGKLAIGL